METIEQKLARLESENASLKDKAAKRSTLSLKVSEKKALSLYGTSRFPITLYRSQWEKVLDHADTIRAFIKAHEADLAVKE